MTDRIRTIFTVVGAGVVVGAIVGLAAGLAGDPPPVATGALAGVASGAVAVVVTSTGRD